LSAWYEEMAAAMRRREVAINGRERWQVKVNEAEAEIAELTQQQRNATSEPTTKSEPTAAAFATGLAPDYSASAE
jgi:hypothetical protein